MKAKTVTRELFVTNHRLFASFKAEEFTRESNQLTPMNQNNSLEIDFDIGPQNWNLLEDLGFESDGVGYECLKDSVTTRR